MTLVAKPDEVTVSVAEVFLLPPKQETNRPRYQQVRRASNISKVDMALCAYAVSRNRFFRT